MHTYTGPRDNNNNNNTGHFYGAWSLARSRAQCAVQKAAEKCINTYNGQNEKGFRPYDRQPRKTLHTAISVNKPKLSVTKLWFEHTCMIQVDILQLQKCTAGYCTHTHRWSWGGGVINYMQIWRDEFLRLAWKKLLMLSDEHHTVTSSTVSGLWKKKLVV